MFPYRARVICTTFVFIACCLVILTSCTNAIPNVSSARSPIPASTASPTRFPNTSSTPTSTPGTNTTPARYTSHVILQGVGRPDDLVFDQQGRLLFSDFYNNTISRINADGSVTVLIRGLAGPEGLVMLGDGTLIIAEQRTNRILALAPGSSSPIVLRSLPGTPSKMQCKDGVDGIALDPTTNTLIIPDSPIGEVYRMSLDGRKLTLLASGITRPVGAAIDMQGNIYIADECGGALWRIAPNKTTQRLASFGMLDDVVLDTRGNVLVTDLKPSIHALIRMNLSTGRRETLASRGYIEPQGLTLDAHDNIYISDDFANIIVKYAPAP